MIGICLGPQSTYFTVSGKTREIGLPSYIKICTLCLGQRRWMSFCPLILSPSISFSVVLQDGGKKRKRKKNIDHHGQRTIPNICHLPDVDSPLHVYSLQSVHYTVLFVVRAQNYADIYTAICKKTTYSKILQCIVYTVYVIKKYSTEYIFRKFFSVIAMTVATCLPKAETKVYKKCTQQKFSTFLRQNILGFNFGRNLE